MKALISGLLVGLLLFSSGCEGQLEDFLFGPSPAYAGSSDSTTPVQDCMAVDSEGYISSVELGRLPYLAPGQSAYAMNGTTGVPGLPYCYRNNTEYYRLESDPTTWIGLKYDDRGRYLGYTFSANNPDAGYPANVY